MIDNRVDVDDLGRDADLLEVLCLAGRFDVFRKWLLILVARFGRLTGTFVFLLGGTGRRASGLRPAGTNIGAEQQ